VKTATVLPLLAYTCKISQESLHRLQAIKRKTGASVSEQIRRGVDLWLKQQEQGR
jgi:hypothetical protein